VVRAQEEDTPSDLETSQEDDVESKEEEEGKRGEDTTSPFSVARGSSLT
jgi:hypothetical protein